MAEFVNEWVDKIRLSLSQILVQQKRRDEATGTHSRFQAIYGRHHPLSHLRNPQWNAENSNSALMC